MTFLKALDEKFEEYFLVGSLIFNLVLIFIQVIMRYIFKSSLSWSEELGRYIFLWQIWIGASYAVKKSKHLRIEVLKKHLSPKGQVKLDLVAIIIWAAFSLFLTTKSAELTSILISRGQLSPAMRLPMGYAYASVPVGCGLMTIRLVQEIYEKIKKLENDNYFKKSEV